MTVSASNASLFYFVARVCILFFSLGFNSLLVGLYAVGLSLPSSGAVLLAVLLVIHVFAALAVFARMIHMFRVKHQGTPGCLFIDDFIWIMCFGASLIVTIRAAHNAGLVRDYSALMQPGTSSAVTAILILSYLAFSLASLEIIIDIIQPPPSPKITPFVPYTDGPPRHRVVFHKNHRPLKIIDIPQNTDPYYWKNQSSKEKERCASSKSQCPAPPPPAYTRHHKQHVRIDEAWSMA